METPRAKYLLWDALAKVGSRYFLAERLGISVAMLLKYIYEEEAVPEQVAARVREILEGGP
jgi:hypothetical protein